MISVNFKKKLSALHWTIICILVVAAILLIVDHWAHVFGILPYLLILACPLMHLFMHKNHGGHDSDGSQDDHNSHRHL
ncbi:MAG: hypothetical protein A2744_04620 [Candidatus Buchananbacteria bacterium RIFCSPHIGHO2_01_FULL_44_11]|uniref:DUF2933 domain-containing protein n=1 Tax=Candidatus Buchananbacteria bacterium RIFCSPHIGHO2_01_FULL_44_11 TaxID=1797535 RepID=A0A1G1Y3V8_9BACT|nr:MAG: hypothetical protein A2744_04620 [Candidatus Buchananbacteria bacterium RIFCSPHIGHO2_01_FULL_44_11]